jgi:hypothetical protein
MGSDNYIYKLFPICSIMLLLVACSSEQDDYRSDQLRTVFSVNTDLEIGLQEQPDEHQLGEPIAVLTDKDGRIYIADRASMEIKVFDEGGDYLQSIGGRGRGPGEFHDMELVELTPEEHLVVLDRGNMRFTIISTDGEQVDSFPYNLSAQFYPQSISYLDGQVLGLLYDTFYDPEISMFERDLFHVYSTDFQNRVTTFLPVHKLGYEEDLFPLLMLAPHPGSFTISEDNNALIFSPGTYTGSFFVYKKRENGKWEFDRTFGGREPGVDPYKVYSSESQYKTLRSQGVARATEVHYGGEVHWGSLFSMDAGLFSLEDGRMVHFYAEWKEGYERLPDSMSHPMDLYVQVFGPDGEIQHHGYLFTFIEQFTSPLLSVVNWMDGEGRFYLLERPDDIPIVRRFSLDLPGL